MFCKLHGTFEKQFGEYLKLQGTYFEIFGTYFELFAEYFCRFLGENGIKNVETPRFSEESPRLYYKDTKFFGEMQIRCPSWTACFCLFSVVFRSVCGTLMFPSFVRPKPVGRLATNHHFQFARTDFRNLEIGVRLRVVGNGFERAAVVSA